MAGPSNSASLTEESRTIDDSGDIEAQAEIQDLRYWTSHVNSKLEENENKTSELVTLFQEVVAKIEVVTKNNSEIKHGMEKITDLMDEQDELNARHGVETPGETSSQNGIEATNAASGELFASDQVTSLDESFRASDKHLSSTAKKFIRNHLQDGPLDPASFLNFLMDKSFGKPNPPVLPILRGYISREMQDRFGTNQDIIQRICRQMQSLKEELKRAHVEYKEEQRRKDVNLDKRIEKLLENIAKELRAEGRCGMRQETIMGFLKTGKKRKFTD